MTVRDKLKAMLVEHGLFENQADAVLAIAIPEIEQLIPGYQTTWDRPAEEYPEPVYAVWWLHIKTVTKKWIAENAPEVWYRSLFD